MKVLLKNKNLEAFDDAVISRPWGLFENIKHEKGYKVKKLLVLPGENLSTEASKKIRALGCINGTASITKGKKIFT